MVQAVILAEFSDSGGRQMDVSKGSEFNRLFAELMQANGDRVIVAHSPFHPDGDAIVFERVTARGALKRESLRWSYSMFDAKLEALDALAGRLQAFVASLGKYMPSMNFSDPRNSQFIALL